MAREWRTPPIDISSKSGRLIQMHKDLGQDPLSCGEPSRTPEQRSQTRRASRAKPARIHPNVLWTAVHTCRCGSKRPSPCRRPTSIRRLGRARNLASIKRVYASRILDPLREEAGKEVGAGEYIMKEAGPLLLHRRASSALALIRTNTHFEL